MEQKLECASCGNQIKSHHLDEIETYGYVGTVCLNCGKFNIITKDNLNPTQYKVEYISAEEIKTRLAKRGSEFTHLFEVFQDLVDEIALSENEMIPEEGRHRLIDSLNNILKKDNEKKEIKSFEVWMEGYAATDEYSPVYCLGIFQGTTFDEAVLNMLTIEPEYQKYYRKSDSGQHLIWGCRLFDNEADARKSFG